MGSATITPELRRADSEGLPCYLETFQPRNVPLYLKHGFQIMAEEVEPVSGLRAWFFLRTSVKPDIQTGNLEDKNAIRESPGEAPESPLYLFRCGKAPVLRIRLLV